MPGRWAESKRGGRVAAHKQLVVVVVVVVAADGGWLDLDLSTFRAGPCSLRPSIRVRPVTTLCIRAGSVEQTAPLPISRQAPTTDPPALRPSHAPSQLDATMSDYGDDYSDDDGGGDWLYVEDEYMQADDLAEHAVASPPPVTYDDDRLDEWDRFDYFNDIEYDGEGYDDANFAPHDGATGQPKLGQKRKRGTAPPTSSKKQRSASGQGQHQHDVAWLSNSPIIWRAQADRGVKAPPLPDDAKPYALLKDWRKLGRFQKTAQRELASLPTTAHMDEDEDEWEDDHLTDDEDEHGHEDDGDEGGPDISGIDPSALMAALQSRLGSAGGPLSGMDPQQLLQFALRMANNQDAGDDIAGELADEMLNQGSEDEDEDAEANLMSWVSQQRQGSKTDIANGDAKPPTPPVDGAVVGDGVQVRQQPRTLEIKQTTRKRKAHSPAGSPAASSKKRDSKPAPAAPPAKAKATRNGRGKR